MKPTGQEANGRREHRCARDKCRHPSRWIPAESKRIYQRCTVIGWGDGFAFWLSILGVTKERVAVVKSKLKLSKGCGCGKRQEAMNTWGWRLSQFWHREKRPFTYCILGTTALAWTVKFLFGL